MVSPPDTPSASGGVICLEGNSQEAAQPTCPPMLTCAQIATTSLSTLDTVLINLATPQHYFVPLVLVSVIAATIYLVVVAMLLANAYKRSVLEGHDVLYER